VTHDFSILLDQIIFASDASVSGWALPSTVYFFQAGLETEREYTLTYRNYADGQDCTAVNGGRYCCSAIDAFRLLGSASRLSLSALKIIVVIDSDESTACCHLVEAVCRARCPAPAVSPLQRGHLTTIPLLRSHQTHPTPPLLWVASSALLPSWLASLCFSCAAVTASKNILEKPPIAFSRGSSSLGGPRRW